MKDEKLMKAHETGDSYMIDDYIKQRVGDPPLFEARKGGGMAVRLNGYLVVPMEDVDQRTLGELFYDKKKPWWRKL